MHYEMPDTHTYEITHRDVHHEPVATHEQHYDYEEEHHAVEVPHHEQEHRFVHEEPPAHDADLQEKLHRMHKEQYHHWEHETRHDEAFKYPYYSHEKHGTIAQKEAELAS